MKFQGNDFNTSNWEDFTHSPAAGECDNKTLFERYRAFLSEFLKLDKKELRERHWTESSNETELVARLFFSFSSDKSNALFRKSVSANETMVSMWLALVREKAEYYCISQGVPKFVSLDRQEMRGIAELSVDVCTIKSLPTRLAKHGIILIYLRGLTGMKLDGAVFRLTPDHIVIGMSLRFPRLDYFWFTLMHELAHIALHAENLNEPVFVDVEQDSINEKAANKLAKDTFVSRSSWRNCPAKYENGSEVVRQFAHQENIHPCIVAGLLRKEQGNYTRYSDLINEHDVREILFPP